MYLHLILMFISYFESTFQGGRRMLRFVFISNRTLFNVNVSATEPLSHRPISKKFAWSGRSAREVGSERRRNVCS